MSEESLHVLLKRADVELAPKSKNPAGLVDVVPHLDVCFAIAHTKIVLIGVISLEVDFLQLRIHKDHQVVNIVVP